MAEEYFVSILGMSITAAMVILAVLALRLILRRAPKIFSYLLWLVVLVRLLCPVSLKTDFAVLPGVSVGTVETLGFMVSGDFPSEGAVIQNMFPEGYTYVSSGEGVPGEDSNSGKVYMSDMSKEHVLPWQLSFTLEGPMVRTLLVIWLAVGIALLIYEGISYRFFMKRVKEKGAHTPFTAGLFRPRIYLPEGLDEVQKELVTEHEKMHIRRLDYLVKPIFFLACCIHWFNPFVWLAFYLMESDMESSCDEAVLRRLGYDRKKDYAYTLLALCEEGGWKLGYPIAFGERNIKNRIKAAARAKKASVWGIGVAVIVVTAATVVLMMNRSNTEIAEEIPDEAIVETERYYLPNESITVTVNDSTTGEMVTKHEYLPLAEEVEHEYVALPEGTFDTTIMNYNTERERDMYEVLILPNPDGSEDVEIHFSSPVESARISDDYGTRVHPPTGETIYHSGIDFAAEEGTPVLAAAEGTVAQMGWDADCGNYVIISHRNGTFTYYSGCKEILVEAGAQVGRGEQIATVGKTGRSTGAHLHFAASKDGKYYEPVFVDEPVSP